MYDASSVLFPVRTLSVKALLRESIHCIKIEFVVGQYNAFTPHERRQFNILLPHIELCDTALRLISTSSKDLIQVWYGCTARSQLSCAGNEV